MTERENLPRPVHKGLRSMIYELGRRLQTTDFTDETAARAIVAELRADMNLTVGNCMVCLLQAHSRHEEKDFFAPLRPIDADLISLVVSEHVDLLGRIHHLSKTSDELVAASTPIVDRKPCGMTVDPLCA